MGKRLGLLIGVLVLLGVVFGVQYVMSLNSDEAQQGRVMNRMAITGALNTAVMRIQQTEKRWPKNLEELKAEKELKALPSGALNDVAFDLMRVDNKFAYYRSKVGGKTREVKIPKWTASTGTPTLGAVSGAG
ncbi:MAG: hypothetical protein ACAH95_05515 [Fimbriimonas sp.]